MPAHLCSDRSPSCLHVAPHLGVEKKTLDTRNNRPAARFLDRLNNGCDCNITPTSWSLPPRSPVPRNGEGGGAQSSWRLHRGLHSRLLPSVPRHGPEEHRESHPPTGERPHVHASARVNECVAEALDALLNITASTYERLKHLHPHTNTPNGKQLRLWLFCLLSVHLH